jgi:diguanylate cyclase (GGDEF)-like protein/PAS domain S-box-containing protein
VVVDHLEDHGFRVAVARNGKEGIKRAKFVEPDLILLDIMMPDMDGFETCRRLKAAEATKDIPVIFMTALEEATDKITGFEAGGVDYITKPFQIAEVLARINIHLSLHAMQMQLARQNEQMQQEIIVRQRAEAALQHSRDELEVRVAQRTADLAHANSRLKSEITERMQAEKSLQQARDELEVRVRERTSELSQAYATIMAEVDERRNFEAALRLRNRAIESSVNAIIITNCTNPENPIEYVNPAFERITGYTPEDATGRNISFLLGDDKDQPGMEDIQAALREQREGRASLRNYRKDGSLFWNEIHIAPVRDDLGNVTHFICIMNDITKARDYQEELTRQASYDTLTGLPNRSLFVDRLAQAIALAQRPNYTVAVCFLDLDRFKFINDSLGHGAGDELLLTIAKRLKSCVRKSDTVARFGGDEFVLILPDPANLAAASKVMQGIDSPISSRPPVVVVLQRILDTLTEPIILADRELSITCSIGVSFFPQDGEDAEALLKSADAAMYRAKEKGRNNFQFYTAEMNVRIAEQLSMESFLHHALERNEFVLHYQPKLDLENGSISGVEVLLRWNSPEKGVILPSSFIPILERTGMINDVGKWVMHQALVEQMRWQEAGLPLPRLAINISQVQLDQNDFVAEIKGILEKTGNRAPRLDFELAESLIMKNSEANVPKFKAIKEMGIGVAIDNFGTGYSSLSHLGNLPVNMLKIDRGFITNLTTNASDRNIVFTVISLAHSMKFRVVAEGVETTEQMEHLSRLGCDEIQGYIVSKPLPLEQYLEWQKKFSIQPKELLKL